MIVALASNPKFELRHLADPESPAGRLIGELLAVYPAQITGKKLAATVADYGVGDPFASLCFNFIRANEALAPFGWQAARSGGTPHSAYFLRPTSGSPSSRPSRRA